MKAFVLIPLVLFSVKGFSQMIFERKAGETAEQFVNRLFPYKIDNLRHTVLEGKWGEATFPTKIVAFYYDPEVFEITPLILEMQGSGKYRKLTIEDNVQGIGVNPHAAQVASVFYMDTNKNGIKELVAVFECEARCEEEVEIEAQDTDEGESIIQGAICTYCMYVVFEQKQSKVSINDQSDNFSECTAETAKTMIINKK